MVERGQRVGSQISHETAIETLVLERIPGDSASSDGKRRVVIPRSSLVLEPAAATTAPGSAPQPITRRQALLVRIEQATELPMLILSIVFLIAIALLEIFPDCLRT